MDAFYDHSPNSSPAHSHFMNEAKVAAKKAFFGGASR
jgi:hypothetical protein